MTLEMGALAHGALGIRNETGAPPAPRTIADTGLKIETIVGLILKFLYTAGPRAGRELTRDLRLPFLVLDPVLLDLQHRHLLQVLGVQGHARGGYVFELTAQGRARAQEAMITSQYVGPAPVPLTEYRQWVERQSVRDVSILPGAIRERLGHMVLAADVVSQVGPAVNSGGSLFLHGAAGNGKTELAHAIARMLEGKIYLPYAFEVEGSVVMLHDEAQHHADSTATAAAGVRLVDELGYDMRYAHVQRPAIFTGGELTIDQLDLRHDPHTNVYRAPLQVKANGGVIVIDDLGRQRVRPEELLNRWMVPLEQRVDYLTLHTGYSFALPFDCLVVFSTNLDPSDLVDEAFLRRIRYKIHMDDPSPPEYAEIFRRCCEARSIPYDSRAVERIYRVYYEGRRIAPRACHPRDIVSHVCDLARFMHVRPELSDEMLGRACRTYFL